MFAPLLFSLPRPHFQSDTMLNYDDSTCRYAAAKCFGQLLNFNCALLLLPIARSFLLFLSNKIVASRQTCAANLPMQHNIKFHKIVARVMVSVAHRSVPVERITL